MSALRPMSAARAWSALILSCTLISPVIAAPPAPAHTHNSAPAAGVSLDEVHAVPDNPDYTSPGPEHHLLGTLAGSWTSVYRVTPKPGAAVIDMPGTAEFHPILGGLWVEGVTQLPLGKTRIEGRVLYGFDRFKQRFAFLFIQQADTQPLFGYGEADSTGRRITFTVPMDVPVAGRAAVPMRTVLDLSTPDHIEFEMNAPMPDGTEYQPLRIDYTRVK